MVARWVNNMKRFFNVLFYTCAIIVTIYTISNYETLTLSKMLFFTVEMFLFGGVVAFDIVNTFLVCNKERE